MERITFYEDGRARFRIGETEFTGNVATKLAEYEDTGLSPEEVGAMKTGERSGSTLLPRLLSELAEGRCPGIKGATAYKIQQYAAERGYV